MSSSELSTNPLSRLAGEEGARPPKLRSSEGGWEGEGASLKTEMLRVLMAGGA